MDKLVLNCTTGEVEEASFTPEEIVQREYEASLPPITPQKSDLEIIQEKLIETQGALDFIVMNF